MKLHSSSQGAVRVLIVVVGSLTLKNSNRSLSLRLTPKSRFIPSSSGPENGLASQES